MVDQLCLNPSDPVKPAAGTVGGPGSKAPLFYTFASSLPGVAVTGVPVRLCWRRCAGRGAQVRGRALLWKLQAQAGEAQPEPGPVAERRGAPPGQVVGHQAGV